MRHLWRTHFGSDRPRGEAKGSRKKRYPLESLKSNFIRGPPKLPQKHYRPMPAGDAQPRGGKQKISARRAPKRFAQGSAGNRFKNIVRRCRPERLSQGDLKKKLANRKAKIKTDWVSANGPFKNITDRCWPGRLNQGDLKKELANRKAKIKADWVSASGPFKSMIDRCWPERLSQGDLEKKS